MGIALTKLALIVDDSPLQCQMLSLLLEQEGYQVITANDGQQGVTQYIEHHPDLVLMDINMPIMNGFEATRQIKQLSKRTLAPLIFITSLDTDESYVEAIEAGGDGILVRPFSPEVFKAKIKSIQRLSDLYHQVKTLQQDQQKDTELAEQLFSEVIESKNFATDKIQILKQSADIFCGDIQLSVQCPNGNVHVLLGDFTGHGLRASIGAIPLAETFRTMSKKGFDLFDIIKQINILLYDLLPSDVFLAACFVSVASHDKSAFFFNAGLPDAFVVNHVGTIKAAIASCHPPIGVLQNILPDNNMRLVGIDSTDHIILHSDGVTEAKNEAGEYFGEQRLQSAIASGSKRQNIINEIMHAIAMFCQDCKQVDDISVIDIPCDWVPLKASLPYEKIDYKEHYSAALAEPIVDKKPVWRWRIELSAERLLQHNPIPLAMNQVQEIEGAGEHWQNLYTILTELFVNALDHGVLKLDSNIKNTPKGFIKYFTEREARLANLTSGFVNIQLSYYALENGGQVYISVKDSGEGFDSYKFFKEGINAKVENNQFSGRGIKLIDKLCDTIEYSEGGTLVEASYVWEAAH
jgi:DNA-binding response OmpR family regulator